MENYETLLNRFDKVLIENEELKDVNKQLNKALDEERSKEAYINIELKKLNNYYVSQLKAIKNFVEEDNKQYVIDTLNDINLSDKGGNNAK